VDLKTSRFPRSSTATAVAALAAVPSDGGGSVPGLDGAASDGCAREEIVRPERLSSQLPPPSVGAGDSAHASVRDRTESASWSRMPSGRKEEGREEQLNGLWFACRLLLDGAGGGREY
jgi:hypothetical protein